MSHQTVSVGRVYLRDVSQQLGCAAGSIRTTGTSDRTVIIMCYHMMSEVLFSIATIAFFSTFQTLQITGGVVATSRRGILSAHIPSARLQQNTNHLSVCKRLTNAQLIRYGQTHYDLTTAHNKI